MKTSEQRDVQQVQDATVIHNDDDTVTITIARDAAYTMFRALVDRYNYAAGTYQDDGGSDLVGYFKGLANGYNELEAQVGYRAKLIDREA